jgi:hypothetical protein
MSPSEEIVDSWAPSLNPSSLNQQWMLFGEEDALVE